MICRRLGVKSDGHAEPAVILHVSLEVEGRAFGQFDAAIATTDDERQSGSTVTRTPPTAVANQHSGAPTEVDEAENPALAFRAEARRARVVMVVDIPKE